jgi:Fur family transcriptional regulator, ferric uptake regulator
MTSAPDVQPISFDDLRGAVNALRERGLRLSTSRRLVLEALFDADGPVSAERLAEQRDLDLASVYRNLETLERLGLARHVHFGHGPGLYVLVGRGEREYLFCERCRTARAIEPEELDGVRAQLKHRFGHEARFTHFAIVGTCAQCARSSST